MGAHTCAPLCCSAPRHLFPFSPHSLGYHSGEFSLLYVYSRVFFFPLFCFISSIVCAALACVCGSSILCCLSGCRCTLPPLSPAPLLQRCCRAFHLRSVANFSRAFFTLLLHWGVRRVRSYVCSFVPIRVRLRLPVEGLALMMWAKWW